MKRKTQILCTILATLMLTCACTKENDEITSLPPQKTIANSGQTDKMNKAITNFSSVVAKALTNSEFRKCLKEAAVKQFDGDYDVLVNHIFYNSTPTYSAMKRIFIQTYNEHFKTQFGEDVNTFIQHILTTTPNLQIAIPVNCEEWIVDNQIPFVVAVPYDFDEKENTNINAINGYGIHKDYRLSEEPEETVAVVGISERVNERLQYTFKSGVTSHPFFMDTLIPTNLDIKNKLSQQLELTWKKNPNATLYKILRLSNTGYVEIAQTTENYYVDYNLNPQRYDYRIVAVDANGNTSTSPSIGRHASLRNEGSSLILKTIKFNKATLQAVEPWIKGKPEIILRVIGCNTTKDSSNIHTIATLSYKRKELYKDNCAVDLDLLDWNPNDMSNILTFNWSEHDVIENTEVNITAKLEGKYSSSNIEINNSCSFKISSNGYILTKDVAFWDNPTYSSGGTAFNFTLESSN